MSMSNTLHDACPPYLCHCQQLDCFLRQKFSVPFSFRACIQSENLNKQNGRDYDEQQKVLVKNFKPVYIRLTTLSTPLVNAVSLVVSDKH